MGIKLSFFEFAPMCTIVAGIALKYVDEIVTGKGGLASDVLPPQIPSIDTGILLKIDPVF